MTQPIVGVDNLIARTLLAENPAPFLLACIAALEQEKVASRKAKSASVGPMRFRVPEIFLGCLLTIAVFAAGMLFAAPGHSPTKTVEKYGASNQQTTTQSPEADVAGSTWLTKDAAGFFTFGLVVVGLGQAILFFFQLRYMRRGMDDATLTAKAAQASADTAKEQVALTKVGIIDLERAYLAVGPTKIRVDFVNSDAIRSSFVGEQFFWGYIEYTDIFKSSRTSRFCTHLSPSKQGSLGKYQIAGSDAWRECD